MKRIGLMLLLVCSSARVSYAQPNPPPPPPPPEDSVCPNELVNSFGLYWYNTIEAEPDGSGGCTSNPASYLFGYSAQLDASELGYDEDCLRKAGEPDQIIQIVRKPRGDKSPTSMATSEQMALLLAARPVTMPLPGLSVNDARMDVLFDDLVLKTVCRVDGTDRNFYFRCQAAVYKATTATWHPLVIACLVPQPEDKCVDGLGTLVYNTYTRKLEVHYEVVVDLGNRSTRKTFQFEWVYVPTVDD